MNRLTDNDRHFWKITYGKAGWRPWRIVWSSEGDNDGNENPRYNTLTAYAFGWCAQIRLPKILRPLRIKVLTKWDEATVNRLGRNFYYDVSPREYGFCINNGLLSIYLGSQTHDSSTTKVWSWFLPWTRWRFIRLSYYDLMGNHFWSEYKRGRERLRIEGIDSFDLRQGAKNACPKAVFEFEDYDGQCIIATTHIEEREWHFGTGWFKWLALFRRPEISRTLSLDFSAEVGPEKGSYKGGTTGHSIEMLPDELHEAAFRRYCDKVHNEKGRKYNLKFLQRKEVLAC